MKYTLFLTQRCNLSCGYCYVGKTPDSMSLDIADQIINFAFRNTPPSEDIDIGFSAVNRCWNSRCLKRWPVGLRLIRVSISAA